MKLDKNYTITGESYNWILKYKSDPKVDDKKKEYTTKSTWYFSNIKHALKKYMDESLKSSNSVEDLMEALIRVEEKINNLKLNK